METLIKIGGSLAKNPKKLKRLCIKIGVIGKDHELLVFPGGSKFADAVRDFDNKYNLNKETAHKMAILGMDQYGLLLHDLIPNSQLFDRTKTYKKIFKKKKIPVFLPAQYMFKHNPLESSWNITSDSIAIYLSIHLKIENAIILTDVDGIYTKDPKIFPKSKLIEKISPIELIEKNQKTCVDTFIANLLLKSKINCNIVNGFYPERIISLLNNKKTICTNIFLNSKI